MYRNVRLIFVKSSLIGPKYDNRLQKVKMFIAIGCLYSLDSPFSFTFFSPFSNEMQRKRIPEPLDAGRPCIHFVFCLRAQKKCQYCFCYFELNHRHIIHRLYIIEGIMINLLCYSLCNKHQKYARRSCNYPFLNLLFLF